MPIIDSTASDSTYHSRHSKRTLARAERIASHITAPGRLLDVGCNNGITSAYMLDAGKAREVTGIELHAETVEAPLREHEAFTLLEGNVVDLELGGRFDHVIYGAVHHHILNLFGMSAAIRTLQKLAVHCDRHLFFETGQLGEGGRWGWHAPMRRLFRTDEEHFFYLVRSIEHLITGFEVIGTFWLHGIRRQYIRGDMREGQDEVRRDLEPWPERADGPWVRTIGSRDQQLQCVDDSTMSESPTNFWIAKSAEPPLFIKKHVHLPIAADAEWAIGSQVDRDWAVQPLVRLEPDGAVAYPYIDDASSVIDLRAAPEAERRRLAATVMGIYRDACELEVDPPSGLLLPGSGMARLVDIIDLNANNFLVTRTAGQDIVQVVDFEMQSTRYASRNRIHIGKLLMALRQRRLKATILLLLGYAGVAYNLVVFQFSPFARRVAMRQPSLASLLVADVRTWAGRALGKVLRLVGIG